MILPTAGPAPASATDAAPAAAEPGSAEAAVFAAAFDALPDSTLLVGADGLVRHANRAARALLGARATDVVGLHCHGLLHAADTDADACPLCRGTAAGVELADVVVGPTALGRRLRVSVAPFRGPAGVAASVHVVREVAEETAPEPLDAFIPHAYRTLLERVPLCVFVKDRAARVISCNQRYADILGLPRERIIGKSIYDVHPRDLADRFVREDRAIMASGRTEEFEDTYAVRDGRRFTAHVLKTPLCDERGHTIGVLGVFWDVAERLRAEAALRESESRYRAILANASDAILVADAEGRFIDANRRAEQLFGYTREELLGQGLGPADIHAPENQPSREKAFRVLNDTGYSLFEHLLQRKDGSTFYAEVSGTRIAWGDSHIYLGNFRDITVRKRTEAELATYRDHLERVVEERTRELRRMNRELESFGYSVSHDLRAPLRAIDGFSAALREELEEGLSEAARGYLDRIHAAALRMAELIDGLFNLSRVSRGELALAAVDVTALAHEIAALHGEAEAERRVHYRIEAGIAARGDRALLRVLLENLFGNARKFTAGCAEARIEFGRRTEADGEVFFVRDNGVGFDMRFAHKLFQPFERLHGAEFGGTGIGLATVRRIAERHGGRVWAEGEVGRGTTVYFTLRPGDGHDGA